MSKTCISDSFSFNLTPSVNIVLQNGQADAMMVAFVSMASFALSQLTLKFPFSSSLELHLVFLS
jgi:hypothetical protein